MKNKLMIAVLGIALVTIPVASYAGMYYYNNWYGNSPSVSPITYSAGWTCTGGICNSVPTTGYVYWNSPNTTFYPSSLDYLPTNNYGSSYNYSVPTSYSVPTPPATYYPATSVSNPYSCPVGYAYYGMPLGCAPLSYLNYCRYNTDACPLGAVR